MKRLACAWLLAAAPFLAWAQPYLSGPEAAAVREVIEAQLDAFKRDDAQRAFSFAAPGIRQMFGTAENFMQMVRSSYAVVYRPQAVKFEKFEVVDDEIFRARRGSRSTRWSASPTEAGASTAASLPGWPSAKPSASGFWSSLGA